MNFIRIISSIALFTVAFTQQYLTGETGHRVGTNQHSQTAAEHGGLLIQDVYALEKLRRFNSERIPERVVHARGAGAHGTFESYGNFSNLTAATFLSAPGIRTEIFVRFSTVIHGRGSPETVRDPRGFAIKFKTDTQGNWDLVGNNLPVFFIRDHIKFPDLVHSLKPDPVTNLQDPNRFFDFFSALGGMATNMLTFVYSDLGIPKSYRFMDGNSMHAYKMVNAKKEVKYVKFRWFSQQGVANLTAEEAREMQGLDFSHATRDLYEAIRGGEAPSWELAVQIMEPGELSSLGFNPLDATKSWPEERFPWMKVGKFVLDRVPENFHLTSEQVSFSPGNFLPGAIEPSEDRLLQGRLIAYHESQVHRHGSSGFQDLLVNRAKSAVKNYNQDGVMGHRHAWKGSVNYEPSNEEGAYKEDSRYLYSSREVCGGYEQRSISKTMNFGQAGETFRRFDDMQQRNLIRNLAGDLGKVKSEKIRKTMCGYFYKADERYGRMIAEAVGCDLEEVKRIAVVLRD